MKEIKLSGKYGYEKVAIVDDGDYEYLNQWSWYIAYTNKSMRKFYVRRGTWNGKSHSICYIHRDILKINNSSLLVDHIDGNTLNNQKSNLRIATPIQNTTNQRKADACSSKYLGVSKVSYFNNFKNCFIISWKASCKHGDIKYLKSFRTEIEAALQYNLWAMELHGEFASLNIISEEEIVENNKFIADNFCGEDEKVCSLCKKKLHRSFFNKSLHGKGMSSKCTLCQREYNKQRYKTQTEIELMATKMNWI